MSEPIIELILSDIKSTLEAITTPGYETDVSEVYRPTTLAGYNYIPQDLGILMTSGDPVRNDDWSTEGNPPLVAWDYPLILDLIHMPSDDSSTPIENIMNKFWADVQKAIFIDPQWNNRALNTLTGNPEFSISEDDSYVAMTGLIVIQYRHREDNPYSLT